MQVIHNDDRGSTILAPFIKTDFVEYIQQKHKVYNYDFGEILVYSETLHLVQNLDILPIPQTQGSYCRDCSNMPRLDRKEIFNCKSLSSLQEEMTSQHILSFVSKVD